MPPVADKGKQRAHDERPHEDASTGAAEASDAKSDAGPWSQDAELSHSHTNTKVVYEVVQDGEHLQPRLRIWVGSCKQPAYVEETERAGSHSGTGIDIRLDKPDSPTERRSPLPEPEGSGDLGLTKEELILVSKPIVPVPGRSLVWSLQRKTEVEEMGSRFTSETNLDLDETVQSHPVKLVKRQ